MSSLPNVFAAIVVSERTIVTLFSGLVMTNWIHLFKCGLEEQFTEILLEIYFVKTKTTFVNIFLRGSETSGGLLSLANHPRASERYFSPAYIGHRCA